MEQKTLYEYRLLIRELYNKINILDNDPTEDILNLKNTNPKIKKISIDIKGYYIEIDTYEEATSEDINNIIEFVYDKIRTLITSNVDYIIFKDTDISRFLGFVNESGLILDYFCVGNNKINFSL